MTARSPALLTSDSTGHSNPFHRLRSLSSLTLGVLVSAYFLLFFNQHLFTCLNLAHASTGIRHLLFMASASLLAAVLIHLVVALPGFRFLFKGWIILLLLSAAMAEYFVDGYGIILDRDMVGNIMQTDWREASELLTRDLGLHVLLWGGLPALLVVSLRVRHAPVLRGLVHKLGILVLSVALIGLIALTFYQDYAAVFRNNRYLRGLIIPAGYVYSLYSYERHQLAAHKGPLKGLGEDAHAGQRWAAAGPRKTVLVLVVGETARADHFSLNGYPRQTNPELAQENLISFPDFHSCGTATAVSLPCMFSRQDRVDFDAGKFSENLLDVVRHAGFDVLWRDNDGGCKGVCDRVTFEDMSQRQDAELCPDQGCFDMILLQDLQHRIDQQGNRALVVLHPLGSHGPAYYLRVPAPFQQFTPYCHTGQLQQCSQAEIVNAYDNSILYTDHLLAQTIHFLQQHADQYDAVLAYVSDHGESLGENNVYLHGLPYSIAPQQQTHIPFLLWMSDGFVHRFGVDRECLNEQASQIFSHDNLFDTVLGLLSIETRVYRPQADILAPCQSAPMI
ncbi:MAG: phosphoethanolamine transferase [Pseudomonadota bacterium]